MICRLCSLGWRSIGHHVRRGHGIGIDEYRARFGLRPGEPLTAPATRERMAAAIGRTIADGKLAEHFATNGARAAAAAQRGAGVKAALRSAGVALAGPVPLTPRSVIEAIVVAIEAGKKVATAVKRSPIGYSTFHNGLRRHPDLRARVQAARGARRRPEPARTCRARPDVVERSPADAGTGVELEKRTAEKKRASRSEIAQIVGRIEAAYPKASLLNVRLAIALLDAPDRTLSLSDLSEAIGKGRDSTSVQSAVARLAAIGIVRRELMPADEEGGRRYVVQLLRSTGGRD